MFPKINACAIDDVPVLWAETPGPLTACLTFGVGRAHETLSTGGVSHLVEHLTLSPLGPRDFQYNGSVTSTLTNFYASGTVDELVDFLSTVAKTLNDLPLERLETERQVLLVEEANRAVSFLDDLNIMRFGAKGFGLSGFRELGLRRLTAHEVAAWAEERFGSASARLWLTGPPPESLSLQALGRGRPPQRCLPRPVDSLRVPGSSDRAVQGCSFSMLGARSTALRMGSFIIAERLKQELRHRRGLIYDLAYVYDVLSAKDVQIVFAVDPLQERVEEVAGLCLNELDRICQEGPSVEEVQRDVKAMRKFFAEPLAVPAILDQRSTNALLEGEVATEEQILREAESTTSQDIRVALTAARDTLLMQVPEGVDISARLPPSDQGPHPAVDGRSFRTTGLRRNKDVELVLGDDALSLAAGGDRVTIAFDDCVALVEKPDGKVMLVSSRADTIEVNPAAFVRGLELRSAITDRIPEHLVVPLVPEALPRRAVEEVAARDLSRRWVVQSELERLPELLDASEEVLVISEATRGMSTGLLVVTDTRLLFVLVRRGDNLEVVEVKREEIGKIDVTKDRMTVDRYGDSKLAFKDIVPVGRARDVARSLGLGVPDDEGRSFGWGEFRPGAIALGALLWAIALDRPHWGVIWGGIAALDVWMSGRLTHGRQSPWAWFYVLVLIVAVAAIALSFVA